jgi:hypothetical protein
MLLLLREPPAEDLEDLAVEEKAPAVEAHAGDHQLHKAHQG